MCELGLVDAMAIDDARYTGGQSAPPSRQDWAEFFSRAGNRGWGAYLDEQLIGTIFLQPDPRHPTHVVLRSLWVDEGYRGQGYGQALVEFALDFADAECYRMVKLWVSELNTSAASLYRHMDFVPTGRLRASAHDPFQHLQQFVLDLRQESTLQI
ncbi:MAG: GNAT family N-acetyltransferase [Verrucomicrobiota bacterium]